MLRHLTADHPRGTWKPYDWRAAGLSIHDRFSQVAERHPDRAAVRDARVGLTYGELERASNRVAHAILAARGDGQEAIAALTGVDAQAVVAALGTLKANKFCVALDPSLPIRSDRQIVEATGAKLILTDGRLLPLARELAGPDGRILNVEDLATADDGKPSVVVALDAIAMLIFTSGSTGAPKGVVLTHCAALDQAVRIANAQKFCGEDRLASFGTLARIGPVWDAIGALATGACICPFDVKRHGMQGLAEWIDEAAVSVMCSHAITCRLAHDYPAQRLAGVRLVKLGGETVFRRDIEACQRVFPNATVEVGLGMTEAGRVAEMFIPPGSTLDRDVAPVGFAMPGVRLMLLGDDGREVAPGEPGQIAVQSAGLAQGYWRAPALTQEKFRPAPGGGNEFVYLTGDLGRALDGGVYVHLGRVDDQVKIRGFQVRTSEVESALFAIDGIREACVVARRLPDGNHDLVAYLVAGNERSPTADALRSALGERLPEHMVPHRFVYLDALPRTSTDKVDRRALPPVSPSRPAIAAALVAPRTPLEATLATIWGQVLGIEGVGVHDPFLDLGGDSLRAFQVLARIADRLAITLPARVLLGSPTIAELATAIAELANLQEVVSRPGPLRPPRG